MTASHAVINGIELLLMIHAPRISIKGLFTSGFCQLINIYHLDEIDILVGIESDMNS